jgi:hydroxymethylpyrimidine pyrophosphatase-like HAD family hydrolase
MAQRFLGICPQQERPLVVVSPRTSGPYFAPLVKAYLESHGWHDVSWVSIRPKVRVSLWETRRMKRLLEPSPKVLVVDDHPNTGVTFGLILGWLCHLGVAPKDVVILAPSHPRRPGWHLPAGTPGAEEVTIIRVEPSAFYKARLLDDSAFLLLLKGLDQASQWASAVVVPCKEIDAVNREFAEQATEGIQVRLKRLYRIRATRGDGTPEEVLVLAKSVGWGWWGYHAYLVGKRLEGSVPPVLGLREGLLISRWVGAARGSERRPSLRAIREAIPAYVAARVKALPMAEDPCCDDTAFDSSDWELLADAFEGVYGWVLRRLKRRALRQAMRKYLAPRPTVIDGALRPEEWVQTPKGLCKVDYEHHAFGSTEANIVDPAYDLASAIFEFALSEDAEQELLLLYTRETGDTTVRDRLCLHKITYGLRALRRARYEIVHEPGSPRNPFWNGRFTLARDFLVHHMGRLCASGMGRPCPTLWTERLFFLDLDGVFDRFDGDGFGFPHTTACGVEAISLLLGHGVSVVLNTARSAKHVRRYCETYGLHGGVAEHGSVFVDQVCRREIPLVDGEASEQLALCRQAIQGLPNVFVDPDYEYAVRAYRYGQRGTVGLPDEEVRAFLHQRRFDRLTCLVSAEETYIVSANVCKETGMEAVKRLHGTSGVPVAAIGSTSHDIPMLLAAEFAYAPSNCSSEVRALVAAGKCRVMRRPYQAGLLLAVRDALQRWGVEVRPAYTGSAGPPGRHPLIWALLQAADRSRIQQWLAALRFRSL